MNMKKIIPIILVFILIPTFAFASSLRSDIKKIEKTNSAWNNLSASFTQKTKVALIDRTISKQGKIWLQKGGKLRIKYIGNNEKTYVSDGTTLWIFIPGDKASLETYAVNQKTIPKEALSFLNGFSKLSSLFKVEENTALKKTDKSEIALKLYPKNSKALYKSLDVLFNKNGLTKEVVIENISKNISTYKFSDIKVDAKPKEGFFTLSSGKATPDTLPE